MHQGTQSPPQEGPTSERLIRRAEVERLTGLSRSTIYGRLRDDPDWPRPVRLGPNCVAWVESEVHAYIKRRIEASRAQAA